MKHCSEFGIGTELSLYDEFESIFPNSINEFALQKAREDTSFVGKNKKECINKFKKDYLMPYYVIILNILQEQEEEISEQIDEMERAMFDKSFINFDKNELKTLKPSILNNEYKYIKEFQTYVQDKKHLIDIFQHI